MTLRKNDRTWVFSDPRFPVKGQELQLYSDTGKYWSEAIRVLAYFTQCKTEQLPTLVDGVFWK